MKKKTKSRLLVLLASLAAAFLLGGCSFGESFEEAIENRDLDAQVTYYANGGEFESTSQKKELYYQSGNKALNIGVIVPSNGSAEIARNNYVFDGWHYAVLDEEGKPIYEDEEKKLFKLGEKVDFSTTLQKGDHWILVAKWIATVKVNVMLVCDEGESIPVKVKDGEEPLSYKNGDIVEVRPYNTAEQVVNPGDGKAPFSMLGKDYTFVEYYSDVACTKPVQWPIKKQDTDVTVYAKYVKGEWEVVRTAKNVSDMFSSITTGKRFWLAKDIDAAGRKIVAKAIFDGEIQGNGYTISNLSVQKSKITGGSSVSLFGEIQATAVIENLKLDGLKIDYSLQSAPVSIYFAFTSIEDGAKITNVKLAGNMTITKGEEHVITTLIDGYTKCLYGGYASDAEYIEQTGGKGFVVEGDMEKCIAIKNL